MLNKIIDTILGLGTFKLVVILIIISIGPVCALIVYADMKRVEAGSSLKCDPHNARTIIYRCEFDDAICYHGRAGGLQCRWKPKAGEK